MKVIFVDAENVGFKGLETIQANFIDKVFVFSRVKSIQVYCEQKLFMCLSEYPDGANQADFYITAYLSRVLAKITKADMQLIEFILYSNDVNLINAFKFQCALLGAKSNIISTENNTTAPISKPSVDDVDVVAKVNKVQQKILNMLKKPQGLQSVEQSLNLSKPLFTKAINDLVTRNKIQRSSQSRKKWVKC